MNSVPKQHSSVLSGMRPTGALHLGNLMGALENWVRLQDSYDCFFSIVDWHSLTTDYADPSAIRENVVEVGRNLDRRIDELTSGMPLGMELSAIYDQPKEVDNSVNGFLVSVAQAVAIVLVVLLVKRKHSRGVRIYARTVQGWHVRGILAFRGWGGYRRGCHGDTSRLIRRVRPSI